MKSNVENMASEMTRLGEYVKQISEKSVSISGAFAGKRAKIRELGSRHNLLKKLQFVFELPTRLKSSMNHGAFADGARYYFRTASLFEHYRDLSVFSKLERECVDIMKEMATRTALKMRGGSVRFLQKAADGRFPFKSWPSALAH
jgi:hypothetical protein